MYLNTGSASTHIFLTILLLANANDPNIGADDLSSPYYLDRLAWDEITFISILPKLKENWDSQGKLLATKYLQVFREDTKNFPAFQGYGGNWSSKVSAIVFNPNSIYHMTRRYFLYMNPLRDWAEERGNKIVLKKIPIQSKFPEYQVRDAMRTIIRICRFYDFPAAEVARGQFMDTKTDIGLRSCHCNEIGQLALAMENHVVSISFLQTALDLSIYDESCNEEDIRLALDSAIEKHDAVWKLVSERDHDAALSQLQFNRLVAPVRRRHGENFIPVLVPMVLTLIQKCPAPRFPNCTQNQGNTSYLYSGIVTRDVCLGTFKPIAQERQGTTDKICWLDGTNALWRINPLRIELINENDPWLILVHNFIGSQVIDKLEKALLRNGMRVQQLLNETDEHTIWTREYYQSAVKGYTTGIGFPEYDKINAFMESILERRWAGAHDSFHSIYYSPGGHYYGHDDIPSRDLGDGERSETFSIYLRAPELGGKTGFPNAGVFITPVVGAATYWANTNPDDGHKRYRHAHHEGCPVILGQKWVVKRQSETKPMEHRNPPSIRI